jgi:hypothetical protein
MAARNAAHQERYTEYDWASEHIADPSPTPDELAMQADEEDEQASRKKLAAKSRRKSGTRPTVDASSADLISASFRLIAERTGGNPFLLLAVLGRVGGMTLKEIGALSNCTKQAVDKHLREIGKKDSRMAALLRRRWHYQAALDPSGVMLAQMGVIPHKRPTHARRRACSSPYLPGLHIIG